MLSHYRILGVRPDASTSEIKKAYRQLARKFHPDHHDGHPMMEHRFRLVAEAYNVLSDATARARYDKYGESALARRGRSGVLGGVERFVQNLESVVDARMKRIPKRGEDRRQVVEIPLALAVQGGGLEVTVVRRGTCDQCHGTRAEPGTGLESCHVCDGTGEIRKGSGLLSTAEACPFCQGDGRIAPNPCTACEGLGERDITRTLEVQVPSGVESGRRLVLRGHGEAGRNGAPAGDLFIDLEVAEHALLERDGYDLRCKVPITFAQAVFGGTAEVPALLGESIRIRIPRGLQSGQSLRLAGRGAARPGGGKGDLFAVVEVETPQLDPAAAESLLARLEQISIHPRRAAWLAALEQHKRS